MRTDVKTCVKMIAKARKDLGMSQTDAASWAGFSNQRWNAVELGRVNPGIEALSKMAEACGLKLEIRIKN